MAAKTACSSPSDSSRHSLLRGDRLRSAPRGLNGCECFANVLMGVDAMDCIHMVPVHGFQRDWSCRMFRPYTVTREDNGEPSSTSLYSHRIRP